MIFFQLVEHDSQQVRTGALDALDRAICGILASPEFLESVHRAGAGDDFDNEGNGGVQYVEGSDMNDKGDTNVLISNQQGNENIALECTLLQPLSSLYNYGRITDVRAGALRILLHVLEVNPMVLFYHFLFQFPFQLHVYCHVNM